MGQLSSDTIPPFVIKRILSFLNRAQTPADIVGKVLDNPNDGNAGGHTIGETVAQRIIDHRKTLIPIFFLEFSQLNGIEGFGQDKLNDLAYTFRKPTAEVFVEYMFENVIGENWILEHYSREYEDREEFRTVYRDPELRKQAVGEMLNEVAAQKFDKSPLSKLASGLLNNTYQDYYDVEDFARFAWALWFYRFASDNAFTFDRIREAIEIYLGEYWLNDYTALVLFKGFRGEGVWRSSVADLPVTINTAEQKITIWRAQLFD